MFSTSILHVFQAINSPKLIFLGRKQLFYFCIPDLLSDLVFQKTRFENLTQVKFVTEILRSLSSSEHSIDKFKRTVTDNTMTRHLLCSKNSSTIGALSGNLS